MVDKVEDMAKYAVATECMACQQSRLFPLPLPAGCFCPAQVLFPDLSCCLLDLDQFDGNAVVKVIGGRLQANTDAQRHLY